MAARQLRSSGSNRKQPSGKGWQKGQSGNPSGLSKAERDRRELCRAHGDTVREDGKTNVQAVLDRVLQDALAGSGPHATLYLAYAVGKPVEPVRFEGGGLVLTLRKRVTDADGNG